MANGPRRHLIAFLSATVLALGGSLARAAESECRFPADPLVQQEHPHWRYLAWETTGDEVFESDSLPQSAALARYREWVSDHLDPDPLALLARQRAIFAAIWPEAVLKFDDVMEGRLGRLRAVSCLEALLLSEHTQRFPLERKATEFQAFVLDRQVTPGKMRLRIHLLSGGTVSPPPSSAVISALDHEVAAGWSLRAHLHNHPFFFANSTGDIGGTTLPSGGFPGQSGCSGDLCAYVKLRKSHGLREAVITNGFSTLVIPSSQFWMFKKYEI